MFLDVCNNTINYIRKIPSTSNGALAVSPSFSCYRSGMETLSRLRDNSKGGGEFVILERHSFSKLLTRNEKNVQEQKQLV